MTQTALATIPELAGVERGVYNGVETALRFTERARELEEKKRQRRELRAKERSSKP